MSLIATHVFAAGAVGTAVVAGKSETAQQQLRQWRHKHYAGATNMAMRVSESNPLMVGFAKARYFWYVTQSPSERATRGVLAANLAVAGAWWISRNAATPPAARHKLNKVLVKYFMQGMHTRASPASLILSGFSHHSLWHLAFNCIALSSIMPSVSRDLSTTKMMPLFLGGIAFSSYASLLWKITRRSPVPSLGASGGLFTLFAATATMHPHAQFSFIFLPGFSFDAQTLMGCLVTFDCVGLVMSSMGRRLMGLPLDHAAHLAGAAFGYAWMNWGTIERGMIRTARRLEKFIPPN